MKLSLCAIVALLLVSCSTTTGPQKIGKDEYFLSVFRNGFSGGNSTAMPAAMEEMAQHCSSLGGSPSVSQIHQERGPCVFCMTVQVKYKCDGSPSQTVITSGGDTSGAAAIGAAAAASMRPVQPAQPVTPSSTRLQTTCNVIGNTMYCNSQ